MQKGRKDGKKAKRYKGRKVERLKGRYNNVDRKEGRTEGKKLDKQ